MKESSDFFGAIGCLLWFPFFVAILFLLSLLFDLNKVIDGMTIIDYKAAFKLVSAFTICLFIILYWRVLYIKEFCKDKIEALIRENQEKIEKQKKENEQIIINLTHINDAQKKDIKRREDIVRGFIGSLESKKYCAELISDFKTVVFEEARGWLLHRNRPAPSAAETVRLMRLEARKNIEELKQYKYTERERIEGIERAAQAKVNMAHAERNAMRNAERFIRERLKSTTPFREVAELYSDVMALAYDRIAQELRNRVRPANTTADRIEQELKRKIRETTSEAKELKYRWEFLMSIFPDLRQYVEEDESLLSMAEYNDINDFREERDRAHDYLSDEEWNQLSTSEKYQLALERYKSNHKPNAWIAGAEYEMYCCYLLKRQGYSVVENGIIMRTADMGRDIIAYKDGNTYIIQCKRYSMFNRNGDPRYIHENIICQLYGTTIAYQISNHDNSLFRDFYRIIPILYTTGQLSDTAEQFAQKLDVKVVTCPMGEYPMIKCNINNGEKIYHLPFDQQYWRTQINTGNGEFYAWTVEEAENKGFRRAMRWQGTNPESE